MKGLIVTYFPFSTSNAHKCKATIHSTYITKYIYIDDAEINLPLIIFLFNILHLLGNSACLFYLASSMWRIKIYMHIGGHFTLVLPIRSRCLHRRWLQTVPAEFPATSFSCTLISPNKYSIFDWNPEPEYWSRERVSSSPLFTMLARPSPHVRSQHLELTHHRMQQHRMTPTQNRQQ